MRKPSSRHTPQILTIEIGVKRIFMIYLGSDEKGPTMTTWVT